MTHDGRNDRPDEQTGAGQRVTLLDRQLDALIEELEIEPAPASLTRRLYRIPQAEQGREAWWRRRRRSRQRLRVTFISQGLIRSGSTCSWLFQSFTNASWTASSASAGSFRR